MCSNKKNPTDHCFHDFQRYFKKNYVGLSISPEKKKKTRGFLIFARSVERYGKIALK